MMQNNRELIDSVVYLGVVFNIGVKRLGIWFARRKGVFTGIIKDRVKA